MEIVYREGKIDYHSYKINESEIFLGPAPVYDAIDKDFFDSFDAYISVTETFIKYPTNKPFQWFPWKETTTIFPDTVLFGVLHTLNYWVNELKIKKIYLHCDGATHRAPSALGAFLHTYYKETENEIAKNVSTKGSFELYEKHVNPVDAYKTKMIRDEKIEFLANFIKNNPRVDLEQCLEDYIRTLPDHLVTKSVLKERRKNSRCEQFYKEAKDFLEKNGYLFEKDFGSSDFIGVSPAGEKIVIWLRNHPDEKYHGVIGLDIKRGPIFIFSPVNTEQFKLKRKHKKFFSLSYSIISNYQLTTIRYKNDLKKKD